MLAIAAEVPRSAQYRHVPRLACRLPQPVDVKGCPTCGREVAESVDVCDACAAWATALVQAPKDDDPGRRPDAIEHDATPVGAVNAVPTARAAAHRQLTLIAAAGVVVVALTGFAMSTRSGSASATAAVAATPVTEVRPETATVPEPVATAAVQTWSVDRRRGPGNQRRGATFELASENVIKTWFGPARASLVLRCAGRSVEAFVVTGSPMKVEPKIDGKTVTVRLDDEPLRTEAWIDSDDHTAVFAPDAAAFVQRLRKARTFDFGYSPHNSSDAVSRFHVSGLDALIGAASRECGAPK